MHSGEMQQALTTPVGRVALLAAAVLAMGAVRATTKDHAVTYRLHLDAPVRPDAIYLTRWHLGEVRATFDDGELAPISFRTTAHIYDGCTWEGTETLTPMSATQFHYDYSERRVSCDPGADLNLMVKTPRQGIVTIEKL